MITVLATILTPDYNVITVLATILTPDYNVITVLATILTPDYNVFVLFKNAALAHTEPPPDPIVDKTSISFTWNAPDSDVGPVIFV